MINFPEATECSKVITKDKFTKNERIAEEVLANFKRDIVRIVLTNKLNADTLNMQPHDIDEIAVLTIEMQRKKYEKETLEIIAKHMGISTLFILTYDNETSIAFYAGKLYSSEWQDDDLVSLEVRGETVAQVWENFAMQVAIDEEIYAQADIDDSGLSIEEKLKLYDSKLQLLKDIAGLKRKIRSTDDFTKRADLKKLLSKLEERL